MSKKKIRNKMPNALSALHLLISLVMKSMEIMVISIFIIVRTAVQT